MGPSPLLIVLLILPASLDAYECFYCGPATTHSCEKPATQQCSGSCSKSITRLGTSRGCYKVWFKETTAETKCYDEAGDYYCICNSDRCNSSIRSAATALGVIVAGYVGFLSI